MSTICYFSCFADIVKCSIPHSLNLKRNDARPHTDPQPYRLVTFGALVFPLPIIPNSQCLSCRWKALQYIPLPLYRISNSVTLRSTALPHCKPKVFAHGCVVIGMRVQCTQSCIASVHVYSGNEGGFSWAMAVDGGWWLC